MKTKIESLNKNWVVANLVSSKILTSYVPEAVKVEAGIDKIILLIPIELNIYEIMNRSKCHFPTKIKKLKEGYFLKVGIGKKAFLCKYRNYPPHLISRICFNPNYYSSFLEYEEILTFIFGPDVVKWKIQRMDFSLDFYIPYLELIRGLDIKKKYKVSMYQDSQKTTGMHIGSGDDKYSIYCKNTENKNRRIKNVKYEGVEVTRVERQMCGKKVPVQNLVELRNDPSTINGYKIFESLTIFHVQMNTLFLRNTKSLIRKTELAALFKHFGFFISKKCLNSNNNFERDYRRFFILINFVTNYREVFSEYINRHFSNSDTSQGGSL